ncbi:Protein-N(5)-glutamine methyltransferase PrmC, methylates polypeptide chain release factors RF1 and RF2 [Burkholderiales bacterium 8X]|nr:Protein-N(5)-glutamine methyltransferase PrmC, methylates polypeptide chain release factors RF1 and RF2 [Burkholderiales bacterium 8X]
MPPNDTDPLLRLADALREAGYAFTTVTPETHRRVLARESQRYAASLRDVFGWNLPFDHALLPDAMLAALRAARMVAEVEAVGGQAPAPAMLRSKIRFATLGRAMFMHSAYPTVEPDAVFFGPDTYRFVSLIERVIASDARAVRRVLDVGCGSGAGGLCAGQALASAGRTAPSIELVDINPKAIEFARFNAFANGWQQVDARRADLYAGTRPGLDLIVANPPYLVDPGERLYRHGGGSFGFDLSLRIVAEGLPLLAAGGRLVLYTGVPIVGGRDPFFAAVAPELERENLSFDYREIDPDVFGEELDAPAYRNVERIAAVALVVERRASQAVAAGPAPSASAKATP